MNAINTNTSILIIVFGIVRALITKIYKKQKYYK